MKLVHEERSGSLWCGDAEEYLFDLDPSTLGKLVVIADIPYGDGKYSQDKLPSDETLLRMIDTPKCCALFGWPELLVELCVDIHRKPKEWITWAPPNKHIPRAQSLKHAEAIAIFGSPPEASYKRIRRPRSESCKRMIEAAGDKLGGRLSGGPIDTAQDGDVWTMNAPGCGFNHAQRLHPNQKPIELMHRLIMLCSEPGDTVVDPFMGSGSTCVAARNLGRRFVGIDIDEVHCETARKRLGQAVLPLEAQA